MALFSTKNLATRQQLEWVVLAVIFSAVGGAGVLSHNVETQRALDTERTRLETLVDVVGSDMALNLDAMDRALSGVVRKTFLRGAVVDGQTPTGRLIRRGGV